MAQRPTLQLLVDGAPQRCDRVEIDLALSRPFVIRARIQVLFGDLPSVCVPGASCELTVEGAGNASTFVGLSLAAEQSSVLHSFLVDGKEHAEVHHFVDLTIGPELSPLRFARTHRVLADRTLAEAVKIVAPDLALELVDAPGAGLPFVTQHDESDWGLLERLFAQAGLAYWYEPEGTKLVAGPTDGAAVSAVPGGKLPFEPPDGEDIPLLENVVLREVAVHAGVVSRDRPIARPQLEVKAAAGEGPGISRWPARARDQAHLEALAKLDHQSHRAQKRVIAGEITRVDVLPGRTFVIDDHPNESCNGTWLCTTARIVVRTSTPHLRQAPVFFASFEGVPKTTPQPPPVLRTRVSGHGVEPAEVLGDEGNEISVRDNGEVRVRPRWDRVGTTVGIARPARVVQDLLQEAWAIPRVSTEVLVTHVDDDHDRPLVVGYLHDPLHPTAFTLPGEKAQTVLRTPTSPATGGRFSEIRFDDAKDAGVLAFRAGRDFRVDVGNERGIRIAGSHAVTVKKSRTDLVKGDEEERITKDTTEKVSGKATETVDGHQSITVKGAQKTHVAKTLTQKTKGASTVDVTGTRKLEVTGDVTSDVAKDRQRTILGKHTAKAEGAWKLSLSGGWDRTFADALAITIAQKRAVEAADLRFQVAGSYTEKRGAAALTKTGGKLGYSAIGALSLDASGPLTVSAQAIELDVASEITLQVGSSTVKITSSGIELKGALVTIPAALATLKGATVKHNQ